MAKPPTPRDVSSASPILSSRPPSASSPSSKTPTSQSKPANPSINVAAQFHRFRLSEFNRDASSPTTSSAPAGQCSRFRVSDFVPSPWTSDTPTHTPTTPLAVSPVMNGRPPSAASGVGSPVSGASARQGSFSVMHMDMDGTGPQQTSSSVAAAAGSGRGVLQKIAVSSLHGATQKVGANMGPRPIAPTPKPSNVVDPKGGFDPSTVPQQAVWELSRIMTIFRQLPPESIVAQITDALIKWPSLNDGSLLRRIGEVFPSPPPLPPPPPPPPPPPSVAAPVQNGVAASSQQEQVRKKRGRPPGKKTKLNDGTSVPVPIAASPIGLQAMAPPPLPFAQPMLAPVPVAAPAPGMSVPPLAARGKNTTDKIVNCTRCLKPFNPTWRATPASDPSSEATCAVKHPYKGFEVGLEAVTMPRRKNNYKTTWKWKCCGREVQSTSEQLLMWPRKEDDRTGGWCFVGKHTTELGVREKLGLKPGKGKKISEEISKKRRKGLDAKEALVPGQSNGNAMAVSGTDLSKSDWTIPENADLAAVSNGNLQHAAYELSQPQQHSPTPTYLQSDSALQSDGPPKRKRGRPKGSKTRSKIMQMTIPGSTKEPTSGPVGTQQSGTGPEQQLISEASQHTHLPQPHGTVIGVDSDVVQDQNSFWTQYTEPNLEIEEVDEDEENDEDDEEDDSQDDSQDQDDSEDPAISTADLSLLASATAAMSATQHQALSEEAPAKRKRGRPKGSRNGKVSVETTQKALRMKPTPGVMVDNLEAVKDVVTVNKNIPAPVPDPVVIGTDEGAPFVGMGAMDYGGLGSGDGGGWFG